LCFGEATKVCAFLLNADKTYRVTAKIGTATDTGDATGSVIDSADVPQMTADESASAYTSLPVKARP
jgi:tRNA pseudouridine55 synthase